jgi:hypothetical protein
MRLELTEDMNYPMRAQGIRFLLCAAALALTQCTTEQAACSSNNCAGCCDENRQCQPTTLQRCGSQGAACMPCANGTGGGGGAVSGDTGGGIAGGSGGSSGGGGFQGSCSDTAKLVYVLNQKQELLTFDPRLVPNNPFTKVATVSDDCIGEQGIGRQVLAMSVDRAGVIWIFARSSAGLVLLQVDSANGFACSKRFLVANLPLKFMAFAADAPGSASESLFAVYDAAGGAHLGVLDLSADPIAVKDRGVLDSSVAGLTGTGDGKLWSWNADTKQVVPIDPQTAKGGGGIALGSEQPLSNRIEPAFAFFGGAVYVLPDSTGYLSNKINDVFQIDLTTKKISKIYTLPNADIVGAGVSACAPIEIN